PSKVFSPEKPTRVLLSQPKNYPTELVAALTRCFQSMRQVRRAYLAHCLFAAPSEKPHTLIGLEVSGDWHQVAASAGMVAQSVEVPHPPVDFMQMTGKSGVENYFKSVKPFYDAKP
ncbi:MAG TPA: enhanced serine sensitivity protein SseB C-terminal domain-containing protein, partial [Tepidisphaeraceae bacterium]|nr:enhanced serine sensitivity protein SseB C-terminal domain-containing protein [Tepidisphaeraceae bacterium]